jgi:Pilus assembly protein, PilO
MNVSDLRQLELKNIGSWPRSAKAVAIGLVCLLVLAAGWYVDLQDQTTLLEQVEQKELVLKQDLESKQAKVVNLDALTAQLEDIKQSFGDMLKRLPITRPRSRAFWSTSRSRGSGPAWNSSCSSPATSSRPISMWSCRSRSGSPGAITSSVSSSVASPIFHASSRNTTSISPLINRVGGWCWNRPPRPIVTSGTRKTRQGRRHRSTGSRRLDRLGRTDIVPHGGHGSRSGQSPCCSGAAARATRAICGLSWPRCARGRAAVASSPCRS